MDHFWSASKKAATDFLEEYKAQYPYRRIEESEENCPNCGKPVRVIGLIDLSLWGKIFICPDCCQDKKFSFERFCDILN
ncbi:MAG: hypothetical protein LBV74_16580 [Tannerella sp.]|jgi:hypothetical protein|nr:hypothetical protein [Tannerella sp.]